MTLRNRLLGSALAACGAFASLAAAQEPHYGAEQRMKGKLVSSMEISTFNGCWFVISSEAMREFEALVPRHTEDGFHDADFDLEIIGREARAPRPPSEPGKTPPMAVGFGHMNMLPCQIEAVRVLAAQRLKPATTK